jgi:hypothetical protein
VLAAPQLSPVSQGHPVAALEERLPAGVRVPGVIPLTGRLRLARVASRQAR